MNHLEERNTMKPAQSQSWLRWPALGIAAAGLFLGALPVIRAKSGDAEHTTKPAPIKLEVDERPLTRDTKLGNSFAPVVKKVAPSVVKVSTSTKARFASGPEMPDADNPMFRWFFGEPNGSEFRRAPQRMPRQHGVGSGVIVTRDGYILTNNHVVDGADEVKIALADGRELDAKVIGRDPKTDIAVVKVDARDLPHVEIADSDKIEVGDLVLAIGNPFGIGQSVTTGIVSAKGRATLGLDYEDFIQTDAAINPGNSGGALVDAEGRLIGINTAILSRSGGNQGIGFAIPANLARDVMEDLVKDGKVTRGFLGVHIQDVTPTLARKLDLKDQSGALVAEVTPKGPADKAGLESGDVIVEFDGKPVQDSRHLKLAVGHTRPGDPVTLKVLRDGDTKSLKVTVRELPGDKEIAQSDTKAKDDEGTLNGVGVTDLDGKARREYGIPEKVHGALVTEVEPDSPAAEAGLKAGDVILEINKEAVKGSEDAVRLTERPKDKTTLLKVWSKGGTRFVVVDESKQG
jgi:serine protease Do